MRRVRGFLGTAFVALIVGAFVVTIIFFLQPLRGKVFHRVPVVSKIAQVSASDSGVTKSVGITVILPNGNRHTFSASPLKVREADLWVCVVEGTGWVIPVRRFDVTYRDDCGG